jgi:CubicO group peptidase (beta-lactamase class C family)
LLLLIGTLCLTSCSKDDPVAAPSSQTTAPTTTTAARTDTAVPAPDWQVEAPADHGIDVAGLQTAKDYAFQDGANTQGLVIVHRGAIVGEWYADGSDENSWAASWSMAKSVTSAVVGIAIEEGKISGVDEPMTTWYPEFEEAGLGDVTLRDVLQMSTGQQWNEDYDPANGQSDIITMVATVADQLEYATSRPPEVPPSTEFAYSSGTSMLLSGVIEQATGMPTDEYAQGRLFDPIAMTKVDWWRDGAGHTLTYCCIDTPSRDFARLGLLYLHDGRWGDDQVVPEQWVRDSLTASPTSEGAYGYQWWLDDLEGLPADSFHAQGFDGQLIYVVPSLDLVVVRNGSYVKDPGPPVAEENLFSVYPPSGLVEGRGTTPPDEDWDRIEMLRLIVDAVAP